MPSLNREWQCSPASSGVKGPYRSILRVMRAFVRLRRILASHADLARKLDSLEKKYDTQFKVVFDVIRELMKPPETKKRPIGFLVEEAKVPYITKTKRKS
jgi:hypothetical protein